MQVFLTFLLTTLVFLGCDGTYDNATTESEQAFSVSMAPAFAPGVETAAIPVNSQLILHTSSSLNPSTVNESTVSIQSVSGVHQPTTVTLVNQDIVLQPKVYLIPNTEFKITVTTEVATSDGAHLTRDSITLFSSGSATGDTTPPTYLGTNIKSTGSVTHPYSTLYFQFDEPLSPLSVTNNTVTISHPTVVNEIITGTVGVTGSLLYFKPSTPFKTFEQIGTDIGYDINLSLTGNISDLSGNVHTSGSILFDTLGESNAPVLTQTPLINNNSYYAGNTIYALERQNSTLFAGGINGLHIINYEISNSSFNVLSTLHTPTMGTIYTINLDILSKRAYLATSTGVTIVDISNLNAPSILSHYPTSSPVYGVEFNNDHLYLAASTEGIIDLNISYIEAPQFINQYNTIGIAFDVMFTPDSGYGDFIHIADYANGLSLFRDTLAPPEQGSFSTFPGQIRSLLQDQNSSTQYIALSSIGGFYTYDLQSTPPPSMIRKSLFPSYATQAVSNSNLTAYINLKYMGIGLLDYSSAVSGALFTNFYAAPFEISTFTKIAVDGYEHLILVNPSGSFHAINVK